MNRINQTKCSPVGTAQKRALLRRICSEISKKESKFNEERFLITPIVKTLVDVQRYETTKQKKNYVSDEDDNP